MALKGNQLSSDEWELNIGDQFRALRIGPHSGLCPKASARSKSELASALGHRSVSGKLNERIREMLDEDLIEYTIPDKTTSRLQKYRLTEKVENCWRKDETGLEWNWNIKSGKASSAEKTFFCDIKANKRDYW